MTRPPLRIAAAIGIAIALVTSGCSLSDLGATDNEGIAADAGSGGTNGSSDGGSFVGNSGASADFTGATDGSSEDPNADDLTIGGATDEPADEPTESSGPGGTDIEQPDLSTDPDVVYFPGTCFLPDPSGGDAFEVRCDEPHTIEIYAIVNLPGGEGAPFQGLDAAIALCNEDFIRITGVGLGLATVYGRSVLRPSEETWADGERDVTCYVEYPEEVSLSMVDVNPVRSFGRVSVYGFEVGDCFIDFDEGETTFDPVSCDEPHDAEVFIDFEYPEGAYPGDEAIDQRSEELCFGQPFEDFVGRDYPSSSVFALRSTPNADTWAVGDRTINCILTDELVRTGSFEGTGL